MSTGRTSIIIITVAVITLTFVIFVVGPYLGWRSGDPERPVDISSDIVSPEEEPDDCNIICEESCADFINTNDYTSCLDECGNLCATEE